MSAAVDVGQGTTITFGTSSFTAQLINIDHSGFAREPINTTYLGTTAATVSNATYIPSGVVDPGALSFEINFNPDDAPPMVNAAETITVTFAASGGDSTGATWAGSGFMTEFNWGVPENDRMTANCSVKFSGELTLTDGSV